MSSSSAGPLSKGALAALALIGSVLAVVAATRAVFISPAAHAAAPGNALNTAPTAALAAAAVPVPAAEAAATPPTTRQVATARYSASAPAPSLSAASKGLGALPGTPVTALTQLPRTNRENEALRAIGAPGASVLNSSWPPAGLAGGVGSGGTPGIALSRIQLPGLSLALTDITDASAGTSGMRAAQGIRTHTILDATLDLDQFMGWKGATLFAQHKMKRGANGSGAAGLMQNHSNIDADDFRAAGEIWLEQKLFSDVLRIKAGRLDFNSEFAATDNGSAFLNASMGYSPAIAAAPTFPLPISAVNVFVSPREGSDVSLGAFDGRDGASAVPGHASRFYIGQLSQSWSREGRALDGRVSIGGWHHTGMFSAADDESDEPHVSGAGGWYGTMDLTLWRAAHPDSTSDDDAPSVAMFLQLGRGNPHLSVVDAHHGVGFVTHGVVPHRRADAIGFGLTHAEWSGGRETIHEAFYHAPLGSHLTLVADLQHVGHFDGLGRRTGFIPNLRTIVNF